MKFSQPAGSIFSHWDFYCSVSAYIQGVSFSIAMVFYSFHNVLLTSNDTLALAVIRSALFLEVISFEILSNQKL